MRESPAEASEDSQNDSKPQTQDTSQNSNSGTDSKTLLNLILLLNLGKVLEERKENLPMFVT